MINRAGQFLGNYRLIEHLGKGGYAEVYKGEHIHLGTFAAIKVLKTINTNDEIMRFRTEARIIASLEHPNIIRIRDFDISHEGTPFLVMDYARKGSLQELLPRGRALPYVTVVSYIKQIAAALQYAHDQKNLIHCDVKPANMLMLNHNKIVLSDFGVALIAQSGRQDPVGTVHYMAPEQIQGRPVLASDQYALGVVAYEWLSGDRPFQGTIQEIRYQHLHKYPPGLNGRIPAAIEQVILRALAKNPHERFPGVKEFADALEDEYQRAAQNAQNSTSPISSVRPNISVSGADSDSTTVFFSGPTVQPMASAGVLIERYEGLLREFHQLNSEHARALQELKQYSDQEIAKIEAAIQQDQQEVNQRIELVREAVRATKSSLRDRPWSNIVAKRTVPFIQAPGNLEQMKAAQTRVLDVSSKIESSKNRFMGRSNYYRLFLLSIGFVSGFIALLYGIYSFIAWAIKVFGVHAPFFSWATIIGYWITVFVLLLAISIIWAYDYFGTANAITTEYESLLEASSVVEVTSTKQNEALQNTRRARLANHQARYEQAYQQRERKLQDSLKRFTPLLTRYIQEDGLLVAGWDDPRWQHWQPPSLAIPLARLGVVLDSARFPPLPALVICPGGDNLLFKTPGSAKEKAVQSLQSLMLRLLTSQSPGKLRFTLIDPTGLGQNVATFFQLTEYDRQLISGKAWNKREQILQQLTELSDHMGNVIQQYLRNQYDTIDDYNRVAGEIAEPYRILVVVGFPNNFSKEAANQLANIATAGPRCGVYVMMTVDTEQSLPQGFKLAELERVARVIDYDGQNFTWQYRDIGTCKLQLDELPRQAIFGQLLKRIGEEAFEAQQRVEIPFRWVIERGILPEYRWWASDQNTIEEIVTPLGRMGASNSQYLRLGKGTAHHVLIVGQTGSGKTNLLHNLIVGLSLIYTPGELDLYLIDFKTVGFTPYVQHKLPHARVIAIQSEREYGLSILEGLEEELEQRKQLFSRAGVQDFTQFRKNRPHLRMPRILLIIDEFQELFMQRDEIAKKAAEHLNRFVRTGRGLGIHVILASQTLAGLSSLGRSTILDNSTITQMTVRIAMKNEKADSHLILNDDNSSSGLLFQFRPGEAIYNADSGAEEGNKRFQSFWLSNEELSVYLDAIRQLARHHNYVPDPARYQKIFDGSKNADVNENHELNALLLQPGWPVQPFATIWLGDPISLKEATHIQLRPRRGSNLLLIDHNEQVASGLLSIALFTLAAQHNPQTAHFYILDGRPDTPYIDRLRQRELEIPHNVSIIDRHRLASLLTDINEEIKQRAEMETDQKPPIYLFISGLHNFRALRYDEKTPSSLTRQFSALLRNGPEQGIHTLIWCDMLNNFNRSVEANMLEEFDMRVAFQMSENDSTKLLHTPEANRLDPYRALLFKARERAPEKFIPYEPPSNEWLKQTIDHFRQK